MKKKEECCVPCEIGDNDNVQPDYFVDGVAMCKEHYKIHHDLISKLLKNEK